MGSGSKRELDEVIRTERVIAIKEHVRREAAATAARGEQQPFRQFAEVLEFVDKFIAEGLERRPIIAVLGGTFLGKSKLAAHVLMLVAAALGLEGFLEVTVEQDASIDLTDFNIDVHAGVLLDGVGDALFLKHNRESLQGRPKLGKGGRSGTMMYAYPFTFARRAVVATFDLSAKNLEAFTTDHWLQDRRNVIQLKLTEPAYVAAVP